MIISSLFERAIHTALPTAERFPDPPFEVWAVEEFTYLSPGRLAGTTQANRKPLADGYWHTGDMKLIDGPGAESFIELLQRAKVMLDRLAEDDANQILAFSHGQFIRAVAWFIKHGETGGKPELMRRFREIDVEQTLSNCAGYDLMLRNGRWTVEYQLNEAGNVQSIDQFCTDQSVGPVPLTPMTREVRGSYVRNLVGAHLNRWRHRSTPKSTPLELTFAFEQFGVLLFYAVMPFLPRRFQVSIGNCLIAVCKLDLHVPEYRVLQRMGGAYPRPVKHGEL